MKFQTKPFVVQKLVMLLPCASPSERVSTARWREYRCQHNHISHADSTTYQLGLSAQPMKSIGCNELLVSWTGVLWKLIFASRHYLFTWFLPRDVFFFRLFCFNQALCDNREPLWSLDHNPFRGFLLTLGLVVKLLLAQFHKTLVTEILITDIMALPCLQVLFYRPLLIDHNHVIFS